MKITFDIECTPEEARRLMGLPDVTPINDALVEQLQRRVEKGFDPKEMDAFVRAWVSGAGAGMSEIQKMVWQGVKSATGAGKKDDG